MFLTSLLLLAAATAVMIWGAIRGDTSMLGVALALAIGGGVSLGVALLLARRALVRDGVVAPTFSARSSGPSASPLAAPPIVGYDGMTEAQAVALVAAGVLTRDQLALALAYEAAHAARPAVMAAAQRALQPAAAAPT